MGFSNPIVAGLKLIREAIQSPNYTEGDATTPGTGWSINKDGSASFRDLYSDKATFQDATLIDANIIGGGAQSLDIVDGTATRLYADQLTANNATITGDSLLGLDTTDPTDLINMRRFIRQQYNLFAPTNTFGGFQPSQPAAAFTITTAEKDVIGSATRCRPRDVDSSLVDQRILVIDRSTVVYRIEATVDISAGSVPGSSVVLVYPVVAASGANSAYTLNAGSSSQRILFRAATTGTRVVLSKVWYLECRGALGGQNIYDVSLKCKINSGTDVYTLNANDTTFLVTPVGVYSP